MRRRLILALLLPAGIAHAQATSKDPGNLRFEVASIKPSSPDARGGMGRPDPGGMRYRGTNLPLRLYIAGCYRIRTDQISGAPAWLDSDHFDILAEAAKQSTVAEMYLMLRNLLIERCHLQFHLRNERDAHLCLDGGSGRRETDAA